MPAGSKTEGQESQGIEQSSIHAGLKTEGRDPQCATRSLMPAWEIVFSNFGFV